VTGRLKENKVKRALKRGEVAIGSMISGIRSPQIARMFGAAGWDFFAIDTEHGPFDMETVADLCTVVRAEDVVPLVRVPDKDYHHLARPLDNGALGLVCPRVETREQVEHIIRSVKYYPLGTRGATLSGIHTAYAGVQHEEYMKWANDETLIVIQIETKRAVDSIEELVSVAGVDATWIGPFDLSQTLCIPGQFHHPQMVECYERVIEACNKHGVAPGIHLQDMDWMKEWIRRGMRLVTFKTDVNLLMGAAREATAALRSWVSNLNKSGDQ
jgi:4-hydroxy-2-oxoheptanedioate aldolase